MATALNTVFLRLEGPLQAWGDNSKFVVHRTMEAPTKSGIIGLICCAMGLSRPEAHGRLTELNGLAMGVRIDRAGTRWWDFHTVGAKVGILRADGQGIKRTGGRKDGPIETYISRREYLCDSSFLVVLRSDDPELIELVINALKDPKWPLFLGRKSCPPSRPIFAGEADCADLPAALRHQPWRPRHDSDKRPHNGCVPGLIEWRASKEEPIAPPEAEVWFDKPISFDPQYHEARLVTRAPIKVVVGAAIQRRAPGPQRPRANYQNSKYKEARKARLEKDQGLCVFCKSTATTVQHITYRRAGGNEEEKDLRSLCRLCHDAVTMIEYGLGMGLDRINPEDPSWRDRIIEKRDEIRRWRSEEGRRRALRAAPERVRREVLEEGEG